MAQGTLAPTTGWNRTRWANYIDASVPVVGSNPGKVAVAGNVATPLSNDPEKATYGAVVTP